MRSELRSAVAALHRETILDAAERLFTERGFDAATMDEISSAAGYSKRTVYAYFPGKELLIQHLILRGMDLLYGDIEGSVDRLAPFPQQYDAICGALVRLHDAHPFCFAGIAGAVRLPSSIEQDGVPTPQVVTDIFNAGERLNSLLSELFAGGIASGALRADLAPLPAVFVLWSSMAGLIRLAEDKERYIGHAMELSKKEFLRQSFELLYRSIAKEGSTL